MEPVRAAGSRPFVGREQERALLRHLLREAGTGRPAVVVVTGMPGAGKSALLRWAGDAAAAAGAFVLRTSGSEGTVPFDALRRLVAPRPGAEPPPRPRRRRRAPRRCGATTRSASGPRWPRRSPPTPAAGCWRWSSTTPTISSGHRGPSSPPPWRRWTTPRPARRCASSCSWRRGNRWPSGRWPPAPCASTPPGPWRSAASTPRTSATCWRPPGSEPARPRVRELLDDTGGLPLLVESIIERRARPAGAGGVAGTPERLRSIAERPARAVPRPRRPHPRHVAAGRAPRRAVGARRPGGGGRVRPRRRARRGGGRGRAQVVRAGPQGWRFAHPLVRTELLDGVSDRTRRALHRTIADRLAATAGTDGSLDDALLVRVADHLLRSRPPPGEPEPPGDGTAGVGAVAVADVARRAGAVTERWGAWHETARFLAAAAEGATGTGRRCALVRRRQCRLPRPRPRAGGGPPGPGHRRGGPGRRPGHGAAGRDVPRPPAGRRPVPARRPRRPGRARGGAGRRRRQSTRRSSSRRRPRWPRPSSCRARATGRWR